MKINFIHELSLSPSHLKPKGMFSWVDFREDGKKLRENDSFVCLVWKTFSITLKTVSNDIMINILKNLGYVW